MEIYGALKKDHKQIKAILKKLDNTTEKSIKLRGQLLVELKELLVPHARAEEKVLYEPMKQSDVKDADALAFEGFEEHAVVDHLMEQLESTAHNDKKWTAMISVVKEELEHHIQEEEEEIFKKAKRSFNHDEATRMTEVFKDLKKGFIRDLKVGKTPQQPPSHELV